jgi:hypothetical protein
MNRCGQKTHPGRPQERPRRLRDRPGRPQVQTIDRPTQRDRMKSGGLKNARSGTAEMMWGEGCGATVAPVWPQCNKEPIPCYTTSKVTQSPSPKMTP